MDYPTVTQVLGWALPKDFPMDDYYLRRGTWVHRACDIVAKGQQIDADHSSWNLGEKDRKLPFSRAGGTERWADYLDAYMKWWIERPMMFEHPLGSEYEVRNDLERYIGHPDQLWQLGDGRQGIIDLKTGTAPKSTKLQLAAYDLGEPHEKRRRRFALQLRPGEKARVIEYTDHRDYEAWRILVRAWHIVHSKEYI